MRVLVACERSGVIRDAFSRRGHEAASCDLFPSATPGWHFQGDIFSVLLRVPEWDLIISHPDCRYLSSSGLHHNIGNPERQAKTDAALDFALRLWAHPVKRKAMENPVGRLTRVMRERGCLVQTIQPNQFGHDASKATCLVLEGLPELVPTKHIAPRMVDGKPRWANQTDSGQNRLGPSPSRAMDRART